MCNTPQEHINMFVLCFYNLIFLYFYSEVIVLYRTFWFKREFLPYLTCLITVDVVWCTLDVRSLFPKRRYLILWHSRLNCVVCRVPDLNQKGCLLHMLFVLMVQVQVITYFPGDDATELVNLSAYHLVITGISWFVKIVT